MKNWGQDDQYPGLTSSHGSMWINMAGSDSGHDTTLTDIKNLQSLFMWFFNDSLLYVWYSVRGCGVDLAGMEYGPVVGCYWISRECVCFIKCGELLGHLNDCQLFMRASLLWCELSWLVGSLATAGMIQKLWGLQRTMHKLYTYSVYVIYNL